MKKEFDEFGGISKDVFGQIRWKLDCGGFKRNILNDSIKDAIKKAIQLTSKKKDEEFDEFIKKLDWDKDDYDLIKSRVEQSFGTDVNRSLWEYVFNQVCLVFKKKIDELSGEKLK